MPGSSAAGFILGGDLANIQEQIGQVEWHERRGSLEDALLGNQAWIGVVSTVGSAVGFGKTIQSLVYKNRVVTLEFGDARTLFRIIVGRGYTGRIGPVLRGGGLLLLKEMFELDFNDMDDEFLLLKDGRYIEGVSFLTDYRASLDHAPDQTIEYISVR